MIAFRFLPVPFLYLRSEIASRGQQKDSQLTQNETIVAHNYKTILLLFYNID